MRPIPVAPPVTMIFFPVRSNNLPPLNSSTLFELTILYCVSGWKADAVLAVVDVRVLSAGVDREKSFNIDVLQE
jgi:hypothetical protein